MQPPLDPSARPVVVLRASKRSTHSLRRRQQRRLARRSVLQGHGKLSMHPALLTLSKLRLRGSLRRLGRGMQSVRGILLAAFGVLILALLMVPTFSPDYERSNPAVVRIMAPLAILAFC